MALAVRPPVAPMLAKLVRALPADGAGGGDGSAYVFEQKWDGFRALAFVEDGEVDIRSRNDRPFSRYFPEVTQALAGLGRSVVVDGELLVRVGGTADFSRLLSRLHPAASRVRMLAEEAPAEYVLFDLLALDDADMRSRPFLERRHLLDDVLADAGDRLIRSPLTADVGVAHNWLDDPADGVDGVMAKRVDGRYEPGKRSMLKVKLDRTADVVVGGFRAHREGTIGSLLLGLYDDAATLHHVGIAGGFGATLRRDLAERLGPLATGLEGHPWELGFALEGGPTGRLKGAAGRWAPEMERDWHPVPPVVVAEVAFDQVDGIRFRHPARFRRWRPDRDAASCRLDQLEAWRRGPGAS